MTAFSDEIAPLRRALVQAYMEGRLDDHAIIAQDIQRRLDARKRAPALDNAAPAELEARA